MNNNLFSQLFNINEIGVGEFPKGDCTFGLFSKGYYSKEYIDLIGSFTLIETPFSTPVSVNIEESFQFSDNFIKIPYGVLLATLSFYKEIYKRIKSEVMTMVIYDEILKDYKIIVPIQKVSGASVKYDFPELGSHEKYILCMHSHCDFGAFFSGQDDNDEKRAMLYGVIGKVNNDVPQIVLRAKKNKKSFSLSVNEVFNTEDRSIEKYLVKDENYSKVEQFNYSTTSTTTKALQTFNNSNNSIVYIPSDNTLKKYFYNEYEYEPEYGGYQSNKEYTKEKMLLEIFKFTNILGWDAFVEFLSCYNEYNSLTNDAPFEEDNSLDLLKNKLVDSFLNFYNNLNFSFEIDNDIAACFVEELEINSQETSELEVVDTSVKLV